MGFVLYLFYDYLIHGLVVCIISLLPVQHALAVPHNCPTDSVDPIFFFFIAVCDEVHIAIVGGDFKGKWLVNGVLGALDGQAAVDFNGATGLGVLQMSGE